MNEQEIINNIILKIDQYLQTNKIINEDQFVSALTEGLKDKYNEWKGYWIASMESIHGKSIYFAHSWSATDLDRLMSGFVDYFELNSKMTNRDFYSRLTADQLEYLIESDTKNSHLFRRAG